MRNGDLCEKPTARNCDFDGWTSIPTLSVQFLRPISLFFKLALLVANATVVVQEEYSYFQAIHQDSLY